MNWTRGYSYAEMAEDFEGMCLAYLCEAHVEAVRKGILLKVNFKTYVQEYFDGVQPSPDQFLEFLSNKGYDAAAIKNTVIKSFRETAIVRLQAIENAKTFFNLFLTRYHLQQEDIDKYIDEDSIYFLLALAVSEATSIKAKLLARKMHDSSAKQKDKVLVRECWDAWKNEPDRYKGKAAFARDMRDKFPNLESQPVIEGWCRTWERES